MNPSAVFLPTEAADLLLGVHAHVCRCKCFTAVWEVTHHASYRKQKERSSSPSCDTWHKGHVWKEQLSEKSEIHKHTQASGGGSG